ncbi:MAG: SDR family oxidoreductase [Woeseiaceae bacterium]|nr:SDR family oxidoreductase [Woeseiaceae bacterium]
MEICSVVTGAAGGMGRAITSALVDAGHRVVGLDLDAPGLEALVAAHGEDAVGTRVVDLTDAEAVAAAFREIGAETQGLNGLVNNAGTCLMGEFPRIDPDELDNQLAINFKSAFYCSQAAVPLMLESAGLRRIVNISSNGAYNFDVFDPPHYRASKAALDTLTKDLARRYAPHRIRVNSIAPAMTETPLFDVLDETTLRAALAQMPTGEAMRPEQIAAWVAFLMSPAGDVASGNVIVLNQGRDVR